MTAGNGAKRSDRIERGVIRSLRYATFPAAIINQQFLAWWCSSVEFAKDFALTDEELKAVTG